MSFLSTRAPLEISIQIAPEIIASDHQEYAGTEQTMCKKFSGQNLENYRRVSRSVRLKGHSTSIQLEHAFWSVIDDIAASEGMTTSIFLSTIYEEAETSIGTVANFSSLLRTSCLIHLMPSDRGVA